jgi:hypothetical protein
MSKSDTIDIPVWAGHGTGRLVRRDALPQEHPWSTYNYIKNELKLKPEDYGVFDRKTEIIREELAGKTNSELKTMVAELRLQIEAMERAGF